MPLLSGSGKAAFSSNVATEMKAGKPQKQAVAIAYAQQRRGDAVSSGGYSKEELEEYRRNTNRQALGFTPDPKYKGVTQKRKDSATGEWRADYGALADAVAKMDAADAECGRMLARTDDWSPEAREAAAKARAAGGTHHILEKEMGEIQSRSQAYLNKPESKKLFLSRAKGSTPLEKAHHLVRMGYTAAQAREMTGA